MTATLYASIAAVLNDRIEQLVEHLIGEKPTFRSRREIRFYPKGGLVITIAGHKRGIWCDFSAGGIGGDALDLVMHLRQCTRREALAWALGWLRVDPSSFTDDQGEARSKPKASAKSQPAKSTIDLARRIWLEAGDPAGTPVETYLASRGLYLEIGAPLRFAPKCPRGDNERLPAMVALMTDPVTAQPTGVQRTYLRADGSGKADGQSKMMLGKAGVVRLVQDEEVSQGVGLAEGIESALSVMQHAGWRPIWACGSAGGISNFPVLAGIETLSVFADHDHNGAGLRAAHACRDIWTQAGRNGAVFLPPPGKDWNDVTQEHFA